jgi:hypothetical protein
LFFKCKPCDYLVKVTKRETVYKGSEEKLFNSLFIRKEDAAILYHNNNSRINDFLINYQPSFGVSSQQLQSHTNTNANKGCRFEFNDLCIYK